MTLLCHLIFFPHFSTFAKLKLNIWNLVIQNAEGSWWQATCSEKVLHAQKNAAAKTPSKRSVVQTFGKAEQTIKNGCKKKLRAQTNLRKGRVSAKLDNLELKQRSEN